MPEISVIVPVYKVEKYINRCVDSILNQTFFDFELILVDDGSPDNCGEICDEYAKKDNRVVVIHKQNGGLSDARNAGMDWSFANSDSKWITFIDSDDWVDANYLCKLYNYSISDNSAITVTSFRKTDNEIEETIASCIPRKYSPEEFWVSERTNAVVAWGKLYKKDLWIDIRYPIGKINEDEFTTYKLLFGQKSILFIPEQLYFYYINNESITRKTWSPMRLDSIDAFELQNIFFTEKGYLKALEKNIICILYDLSFHMKEIGLILPQYKEKYKELLKRQKKYFKKYHKRIKIPYSHLYESRINVKIKDANIIIKLKYIYYYLKENGLNAIICRLKKKRGE